MENNQVKVTLIKSSIATLPKQKATLKALGLTKIHQSKVYTDSPALQGQLNVVAHLVKIEK